MSVDPNTLKKGDKVKFSKKVVRKVTSIEFGAERYCVLDENVSLGPNDPFWKLAELARPELPETLHFGFLGEDLNYHYNGYYYTPERFLKKLKLDVKDLEAAGVKEEEE